ncbi:MAG: DMT family transporter [Armatimonadota bacterium]|nr:DMT family transporter [Armatimonadota bacterium]
MPISVLLLLIGINLLWAGSSLAAKIALHSIPPMTLAFARFAVAALLLYGAAAVCKVDLRVARRDWGMFWAMGVLGLALTYLLTYLGLVRTTASNSALLHATETLFLSLLAFVFLREAMPKVKIAGLCLGLAGAYLIIAGRWGLPAFSGLTQGNFLIALALVFEASASIVGKGLLARYPIHSVVTYQMLTGAIALAPFSAYELFRLTSSGHMLTLPPASALWSLAYLILPCTVFGYLAWFTVLDTREAGEMSVFLFIQPVAGAFLGAFFLGDKITTFTVIGAVLVLLAVGLVNRRSAPPLMLPVPPGS